MSTHQQLRLSFAIAGILAVFAVVPAYAQGDTKEKCEGNCTRTFYKFVKEFDYTDATQQDNNQKGAQPKPLVDKGAKEKLEEEAPKTAKQQKTKLETEGQVTTPCSDEACECPPPKKADIPKASAYVDNPKKNGKPEVKDLPLPDTFSFPYTLKGGGGVNTTVTYKLVFKYTATATVQCKCQPKAR